ncbi:MAG TPA: endolytic transglycosylase MltG [Syntrophomonadaceae bacterium]|nr:endolytic transglycosylase MltG [Syntrophomonadaceae bacterium]
MPSIENIKENLLSFFKPAVYPLRFGIFIILSLMIVCISCWHYLNWLAEPVCTSPSDAQLVTVEISPGSNIKDIGETLARNNLIKSSKYFAYYGLLTGQDKKMQAGIYQISNSWSMKEIIDCISSGKIATITVTIPEGYTVKQIGDLLTKKGIVTPDQFQEALMADYEYPFLENVTGTGPQRMEGFLFPSTYQLRPSMTEEEIIKMMLDKFQSVFTAELQQRADEMGLTVREVVILASLVEREAKLEEERPKIAAVFLNRLDKGMRLESCATVQYILGKQKEKLTNKDLQNPSPYNTYLHTGLPPGPIANPGLASIKAVLYPADVDYLFFVARGDGSHYFSKTFQEHQKASRRYQN